jgi:hypothetical protein
VSTAGDNEVLEIAGLGDLPRLLAGLAQLWKAYHAPSSSTERSTRNGVSGTVLAATGFTEAHLNLLLEKGFANFATPDGERPSSSRDQSAQVGLAADRYFFLTESGESLVGRILRAFDAFEENGGLPSRRLDDGRQVVLKPHWDRRRRELRVGNALLKRFRSSAPNQEVLLAAFEAAGWANGIDDPLPGSGNRRATVRLDDAIRRLNRTLEKPLIRFEREPTSGRVTWRYQGAREHLPQEGNGRSLLIG